MKVLLVPLILLLLVACQPVAGLDNPIPVPPNLQAPTDPDGDGKFEDLNGNNRQDFADVVLYFNSMTWIAANEPTGALDSRSSDELLDIFNMINRAGQTVVMVTHSVKAASRAGRVLFIRDGEVFHQLYRAGMSDDEMYRKISDTLTVLTSRSAVEKEAI